MAEPSASWAPAEGRHLAELDRAECVALLQATSFGRIVLMEPLQMPLIRPVNYVFDPESQSVVFQTVSGSKLNSLVRSSRAWFEIDGLDCGRRTGWSVILAGHTEMITQPHEIRRLERLGQPSWLVGERLRWVRIRARTISGRRLSAT